MSKNVRNIIITAIISLFVGYMVGGISQTGRCPLTGKVVCKERAAACEAKKECAADKAGCDESKEACESEKGAEKKDACCKDKSAAEKQAPVPAAEVKH